MPAIGLGTFGSDHVSASEIAEAIKGAAAAGYRHFDWELVADSFGSLSWQPSSADDGPEGLMRD